MCGYGIEAEMGGAQWFSRGLSTGTSATLDAWVQANLDDLQLFPWEDNVGV